MPPHYQWRAAGPPKEVYRDRTLVVKWDFERRKPMKGSATRRVLDLIGELEEEGIL